MADVGTIVELSEKIVSITINDARNLALDILSISSPRVVHTMSGNVKILRSKP
jgi:hypothetical protein